MPQPGQSAPWERGPGEVVRPSLPSSQRSLREDSGAGGGGAGGDTGPTWRQLHPARPPAPSECQRAVSAPGPAPGTRQPGHRLEGTACCASPSARCPPQHPGARLHLPPDPGAGQGWSGQARALAVPGKGAWASRERWAPGGCGPWTGTWPGQGGCPLRSPQGGERTLGLQPGLRGRGGPRPVQRLRLRAHSSQTGLPPAPPSWSPSRRPSGC